MEIKYLRPSGINTYLQCSAKYFFQSVERVKIPKALALAFGSAVHKAIETNYAQKIETQTDIPVEEAVQTFSDSFDQESAECEKVELASDPDSKDIGVTLITMYQETIAPLHQPKRVERKLQVDFKNAEGQVLTYGLTGTIDLITNAKKLKDHKTAKKNNSVVSEAHQRQVSFYSVLAAADGEEIEEVSLDYLVKKKNPEISTKVVVPNPKHAIMTLQQVGESIDKEAFLPNRDSFLCTKRFCGYWQNCEKKFGGSVKS